MTDSTCATAGCGHPAEHHRLQLDRDESNPNPDKWTVTPRLVECRDCACRRWRALDEAVLP